MGDPLSITASVIAVAGLGLQSTKFVYETISSLSKGAHALHHADESLQSLNDTLTHIVHLVRSFQTSQTAGVVSSQSDRAFFQLLQKNIQQCVDSLQPIVAKVKRWKSTAAAKHKFFSSLKWYIKDSDLREIHDIVSRQLQILNLQLTVAGCFQGRDQIITANIANAKTSHGITILSDQIQTSTSRFATEISTRFDQIDTYSDQYASQIGTQFISLGAEVRGQGDNIRGSMETFQQSMNSGFRDQTKFLEGMMKSLQQQLNASRASEKHDELNNRLQNCVDRLYSLREKYREDMDIDSPEASFITEDVVSIMKTILEEVEFPDVHQMNLKRKRDECDDTVEIDKHIKQKHVLKKMRGLLDSSESIQIRNMNWQKDRQLQGKCIDYQNQTFETSTGTLLMTSTTREFTLGHTVSRFTTEKTTKAFAGTISILPRTKKRKMQIRASFFQHMTQNGGYSFAPTISFHAVIPDDSKVFQLVEDGDLHGLRQMLQDGLASLTDCDTYGRSLLGRFLKTINYKASANPDICQYLVSKGADVNSFEVTNPGFPINPLLSSFGLNMHEQTDEKQRNIIICKKILLDAGADATLRNSQAKNGWERSAIMKAVSELHVELIRTVLSHGVLLDDVNDRDYGGKTTFLMAAEQSYYPQSNTKVYYVEDSFAALKFLMDRGVDFNSVDNERRGFFHIFLEGTYDYNPNIFIHRPHDILTAVLVRVIEGGGDILAVDVYGRTPSEVAKKNQYERSWREALSRCGHSPQDVYAKSGVSWTELRHYGPEANLIETLRFIASECDLENEQNIRKYSRQWREETLQQHLTSGVQTYGDFFFQVDSQATKEILGLVRNAHADGAFRKALATCGYNAEQIYNCVNIPWIELEDISYEDMSSYLNTYSYVDSLDDEASSYGDDTDSEIDEFVDCESGDGDSSEDEANGTYSDGESINLED